MTVDVSDFEQQVLEASRAKPVLVDFWAPWCGPCRQLGPVLERLADEEGAAFTLAKVNTDEAPDVSLKYAIRSIPAVKLFVDGEVKDEFIGALPEAQVRRWLKQALPDQQRQRVQEAKALIEAGAEEKALAVLDEVLAADPENAEAALTKATLLLYSQPAAASELAAQAARWEPALFNLAQAVQETAALIETRDRLADLPDDPAKQPFVDALAMLSQGEVEKALDLLVQSVRLNKRYHNDAARKASLALFGLLGEKNPITQKQRRALEMALF
jgi:putative thioredoxin